MDLITVLPEEIKHHIISFLPANEASRLSVVSKPWKKACESRGVLEFNDTYFTSTSAFEDFLDQSLQRVSSEAASVGTLRLVIRKAIPEKADVIGRWLHYALSGNLKELELDFPDCRYYKINLLSSETLTKLSLCTVDLNCGSDGRCQWEFPRLQSLSLRLVSLDSALLHNLVSACPRLEHCTLHKVNALTDDCLRFGGSLKVLRLESVHWLTSFKVSSTELTHLVLTDCRNLDDAEIYAPKLRVLECIGNKFPFYSLLNVSSLELVRFNFLPGHSGGGHDDDRGITTVWFDRLKELFDTINHVNDVVVSILCQAYAIAILHEGLSDSLFSVIRNLQDSVLDVDVLISSGSQWEAHLAKLPMGADAIFIASPFDSNNLSEHLSEKLRVDKLDPKNSRFKYSMFYVVSYDMEILNDWPEFEEDKDEDDENKNGKLALLNAYSGSPPYILTRFRLNWSFPSAYF